MNPLESLKRLYISYRHSRGYGVHSPYAYRFVTDVVRPGRYGFYAYDNVLEFYGRDTEAIDKKELNEALFLVRLCNFLKTKRILVINFKNEKVEAVAQSLNIPYEVYKNEEELRFQKDDLLLIDDCGIKDEIIDEAIDSSVSIYAVNPTVEVREKMCKPLEKGLLIAGKDKILLVPRTEMEYVSYTMKF